MENRTTQRNRGKRKKIFTRAMQNTLFWCFALIVVCFVGLLFRLGYIHQNYGKQYTKKALSQQTYVSTALAYKRGDILDRNNTKLATSQLLYNVFIDPKLIIEAEGTEKTASAMASCFSVSKEEVVAEITEHPTSQYRVILKDVEKDQVEKFQDLVAKEKALCKKNKEKLQILGVNFEKKYKRIYPQNSLACSVIGFSSANNEGLWGLENQYNKELNGIAGRSYGYYSANEELDRTVKAAEDGNSIVTTIDTNIQGIVEKKVDKFMQKTGAKQAAVLVMNPNTGEIYAMTSNIHYDLNNAFDLTQVYKESDVANLTEEEKSDLLNQMWSNFCVSYGYEPGSTYKPLTVAAALEEGVATDNSWYVCDGGETYGGKHISCVSKFGHGSLNLEQSLMKSCNDVMMQLAAKMGKKTFAKYEDIFNIGRRTGIDLPGETSGLRFSEENLGPTELATCSFGQSLTVNMLQIACAFSSVINGGSYYKPYVVKQVLDSDGTLIKNIEPTLVRRTVTENTSALLRRYLQSTVEEGTASYAAIPGYAIGGKTGTAEKLPRKTGKYLVSFIGAAPMDHPQVVVYAIVDEPHVKDQAHSTYAQEIVKDVMKDMLPFLGVYKDEKAAKKAEQTAASQAPATAEPKETKATPEAAKETPVPEDTGLPDETTEITDVEGENVVVNSPVPIETPIVAATENP